MCWASAVRSALPALGLKGSEMLPTSTPLGPLSRVQVAPPFPVNTRCQAVMSLAPSDPRAPSVVIVPTTPPAPIVWFTLYVIEALATPPARSVATTAAPVRRPTRLAADVMECTLIMEISPSHLMSTHTQNSYI